LGHSTFTDDREGSVTRVVEYLILSLLQKAKSATG
jgi:hypothetical protein